MSQKMIEFMKVLRMDKLSSERRNKTVLRISSLRGQGRFHCKEQEAPRLALKIS